jgi:pyruvate formate lyase activating enzyme
LRIFLDVGSAANADYNFESLIKEKSVDVLPRIPLIPDVTDTVENLTSLAEYSKSLSIRRIGLLPYNPLWLSKPEKIGVKPLYNRSAWLTKEEKERIKSILSDFEFESF